MQGVADEVDRGGVGPVEVVDSDDQGTVGGQLAKQGAQRMEQAVAVVGLRRLLAEHGVIARLEAKGLRVAGPGEE